MLVPTRRLDEGVRIGDNIKVTVEKISKGQINTYGFLRGTIVFDVNLF